MIDHIVEHVDIFPTVFEIIGRNIEKNLRIQGESLTPFIFPNPGTTYKKKFAFSQRRVYSSQHLLSLRSGHIETICENGEKYALQSQNYKYILCTHGMDEFFDLRSDPYEIHNLIESGSLEEQQLKNTLLAIINELKKHAPSKRLTVDKETTERLKSLGYIQ